MLSQHSFTQIRRMWLLLAAFYLTLLVHLGYYRFVEQDCTAKQCAILAFSQVIIGIGVGIFGLWMTETRLSRIRSYLSGWPLLILGFCLLLGLGWSLRPEWVYAHMALAASALLFLLYWTFFGDRKLLIPARTLVFVCVAGTIILIAIRILGLAASPSIHIVDEPWTLGWAVSYLRTGQPSDWIMLNVSGSPYYSLPRYYAVVAVWLKIVGVGLWEGRLFSLLIALVSIYLTSLAACNLYGRLTALFTAGALLGSSVLIVGLRLRHDIGVTLAIATSLWLYSKAVTQKKLWLHFAAGVAVALGMFAHYHTLLLSVSLWLGLYLPPFIANVRQKGRWLDRGLIHYALGAALGGGIVIVVQVLPDVTSFFLYSGPRSPQAISDLIKSFVYHISQIPLHSKVESCLLITALVAALLRRQLIDISWVMIVVLGFISIAIMADMKNGPFDYYAVPLTPIFGILIGNMFRQGWRRNQGGTSDSKSIHVIAFLCFMLPQIGYSLYSPVSYILDGGSLRPEALPAATWVLEHVPSSQTVAGEHLYFLWVHNYKFTSPMTPNYRQSDQRVQNETLETIWDKLDVDVFIFDPHLATYGILEPLRQNGYLQSRDYQLVFEDKSANVPVQVYQRR